VLDAYATAARDRPGHGRLEPRRGHRRNYNAVFREMLTYMMEDPRTITAGTHLLFMAKNLERIGDHATNIAETIHYEITGQELMGERPTLEPRRLTPRSNRFARLNPREYARAALCSGYGGRGRAGDLLSYNLEKEGYRVVVAADGEEGMVQIEERQPDLVLLDWMLPKLSGFEVCRRIRGKSETRNMPIIMLTARGEESDRVRGLDTAPTTI
jgi:hypothetical protein